MTTQPTEKVIQELARELAGYKQDMHNVLTARFTECYRVFLQCAQRYGEVKSYHESVALAKEVLERALNSPEMKFWKRGLHEGDLDIYNDEYDKLHQRYVRDCETYAKRAAMEMYADSLGYNREESQYWKPNHKILNSIEYRMGWHFMHGEKNAIAYIKRTATDIVKKEYAKLESTFLRHYGKEDIKNITLNEIRSGVKGKECILCITFEDDTKEYVVMEAIPAGGYNIQSFHYRYILKVTKSRSK